MVARIITLAILLFYSVSSFAEWYWWDLWLTRDQQGFYLFQQGKYTAAARRFEHPKWRAISYYADGNFIAAVKLFGQQRSAEGYFNRANALAHLGRYSEAADSFRLALAVKPDWQQAQENLTLIEALAQKPDANVDTSMGAYKNMEADDIVFDKGGERMQQANESETDLSGLNEAQLNELWMRRLKTTPADFLRAKFQYQLIKADNPEDASEGQNR